MTTVLHENKSLKALNISRPVIKTIDEDIFNHYASMLKVGWGLLRSLLFLTYLLNEIGALTICLLMSIVNWIC